MNIIISLGNGKRLPCAFMQRTFQVSARRGSHDEGTYSMHARTTKFYLSQQTPVMHNLYILGLDAQNQNNSNTDHKLLRLFLHFWINYGFSYTCYHTLHGSNYSRVCSLTFLALFHLTIAAIVNQYIPMCIACL